MKEYNRAISAVLCAAALFAGSSSLLAQEKRQDRIPRHQRTRVVELSGGPTIQRVDQDPSEFHVMIDGDQASDHTFVFASREMSFDGKIVKGAPYSAQAITESIQTLADGNRIVHKNTASVYRDGEGRTRREQALKVIGSYTAAADPPQTVVINDPVAGASYTLNVRDRTAHKLTRRSPRIIQMPRVERLGTSVESTSERAGERQETSETSVRVETHTRGATAGRAVVVGPARVPGSVIAYGGSTAAKPKTESLGKQMIEGVEAEGTRITITIAAGEIGNERPIEIVSERWYSPELQTLVMSRHSDPRTGESTYRLTGISRDEPGRYLFEVPADYKLEENGPGTIRMRKPRNEQ